MILFSAEPTFGCPPEERLPTERGRKEVVRIVNGEQGDIGGANPMLPNQSIISNR